MEEFFPPDVRLRVEGDAPETAFALRGASRRLLFLALLLQERYADGRPVVLQQQIGPASYARVFLHQGQKIVTIFSYASPETPEPPPELTPETFTIPPSELAVYIGLLNGWWKDGTATTSTTVTGTVTTTTTYFRDYKPTPATALAQGLASTFDANARLAGEVSRLFWASSYTGSLKRVVQAMWALGEIDLPTIGYISGTLASPTKRTPTFSWPQRYDQSVGLYKAANQNHWLVEVGYRGVLAMPLILLEETKGADYRATAVAHGDTDTITVLDEFGGLPSGEGFPDDSGIEAAITAGKVLRLLVATDLTQPLRLSAFTSSHDSWAFSESGAQVDNVGWHYETPGGNWYDGERITPAGKAGYSATRVAYGEHWHLTVALSTHSIANLALVPPAPLGSGSAALSLAQRGKLDPRALLDIWYASASNGGLSRSLPAFYHVTSGGASECELPVPPGVGHLNNPCVNDGWGCNVHVWYEGEQLHRVRWTCYKTIEERTTFFKVPAAGSTGWYVGVDVDNVYSPKGFVADGVPDLRLASGTRAYPDWHNYVAHNHGAQSALTTSAGANAFIAAQPDATYSFSPGGAGGTTTLIRDRVTCALWLILALGQREGCAILRDVTAGNGGPYPQALTLIELDQVWERILVGRFNRHGEVPFVPPPKPIAPGTADDVYLDSWGDRSPYLPGGPPSFDNPRPAFMFGNNAGPSLQWGAYNGLIIATSTSGYRKFWNERVPTELTLYNPTQFGWLGSVP